MPRSSYFLEWTPFFFYSSHLTRELRSSVFAHSCNFLQYNTKAMEDFLGLFGIQDGRCFFLHMKYESSHKVLPLYVASPANSLCEGFIRRTWNCEAIWASHSIAVKEAGFAPYVSRFSSYLISSEDISLRLVCKGLTRTQKRNKRAFLLLKERVFHRHSPAYSLSLDITP